MDNVADSCVQARSMPVSGDGGLDAVTPASCLWWLQVSQSCLHTGPRGVVMAEPSPGHLGPRSHALSRWLARPSIAC